MRALRWEPIAGTGVVAILAAALATVAGSAAHGPTVQMAVVLCAASLAFAADDLVGRVLPASPTGPGWRLAERLARAVPLVGGGSLAVALLARQADLALPSWPTCLALAMASLAGAVVADRWTELPSPGAAGAAGVVLVVGVVNLARPSVRFDLLTSVGGPPTAVIILAGLTVLAAQRGRR